MAGFYRGSTPTFKLTVNGANIRNLGTPTVVLTQDLVFVELEPAVNATGNYITATLPYADSLRFVPGVKASLQAVWTDDDSHLAVPFPAHELDVFQTHVEFEFDADGTVIEP